MARRTAGRGTAVALTMLLLGGAAAPAGWTAAAMDLDPATDAWVACGGGSAFPLAALAGPIGAELAGDAPARRLARAATTGEAGYVPRSGWMRVRDAPDEVVMATWLHLPRSLGGPLLQVTLATDQPGATDVAAWHIASAGFCWPQVVLPEDLDAVGWTLAEAATPEATRLTLQPAVPACATTPVADPVVLLTPERVIVTLAIAADAVACPAGAAVPVTVALPEPLGARELLDGATDPPTVIQAAPLEAPAASPPIAADVVSVAASAAALSVSGSHAVADALGSLPELVPVQVVDQLALDVTLTARQDVVLAGPPSLCLVGPFAAPDDAGLIDRCWGDPDPGAVLAPGLPRSADGHPMLPAGTPVELHATIARGEVRCDYPPGEWRLEIALTPLADGHGWTALDLPEVPLTVDAGGLAPVRELSRLESRYCGMAHRPADAGEARSPAP